MCKQIGIPSVSFLLVFTLFYAFAVMSLQITLSIPSKWHKYIRVTCYAVRVASKGTPVDVVETTTTTKSLPAALLAQSKRMSQFKLLTNILNVCLGPQIDQLDRIVVPRIATYWRAVGNHLKTDPSVLEQINKDGSGDLTETCKRTLQHWLDQDKKASWTTLLSALEQLQLTQAFREIQNEIAELPMSV